VHVSEKKEKNKSMKKSNENKSNETKADENGKETKADATDNKASKVGPTNSNNDKTSVQGF
jgi:hypothetical protein